MCQVPSGWSSTPLASYTPLPMVLLPTCQRGHAAQTTGGGFGQLQFSLLLLQQSPTCSASGSAVSDEDQKQGCQQGSAGEWGGEARAWQGHRVVGPGLLGRGRGPQHGRQQHRCGLFTLAGPRLPLPGSVQHGRAGGGGGRLFSRERSSQIQSFRGKNAIFWHEFSFFYLCNGRHMTELLCAQRCGGPHRVARHIEVHCSGASPRSLNPPFLLCVYVVHFG